MNENEHDVTVWHSPGDGHHHGADPQTSELWNLYLQATGGREIGYEWLSSPIENAFPYPAGKHEGFTFLREDDTGRPQTPRAEGANYIDAYLLMLHALGNGHEIRGRFHSHYGVFKVSNEDGSKSGYVATGGHADYGILMAPYKQRVVQLPGDPPNWPYGEPEQFKLPYRATLRPTPGRNIQYWNSQGQGKVAMYPHRPNHILQVAWSTLDAFMKLDDEHPEDEELDTYLCPDGSCEFNGSLFQVNAIRLLHLPTQRPFSGFTDVHGHVISASEAGPNAVPLIITAGVPQGDAILARAFLRGNCDEAPCFEFDDGSVLTAPGYPGMEH